MNRKSSNAAPKSAANSARASKKHGRPYNKIMEDRQTFKGTFVSKPQAAGRGGDRVCWVIKLWLTSLMISSCNYTTCLSIY